MCIEENLILCGIYYNTKTKATENIVLDISKFKIGLFIFLQLVGSAHVHVDFDNGNVLKYPEFS